MSINIRNVNDALLKSALWYAQKKNWPVLPLHTIRNGACTCVKKTECDNPGKHPWFIRGDFEHGANSATTNPELIRKAWKLHPDANVGIAAGKNSFDALDVDLPDGPDVLFELAKLHGGIPNTVEQITGSGGRQILFQYAGGRIANEVNFAPSLDIRTDGGLIVAPPSRHISGHTYEWEASKQPNEIELTPFPGWLIEVINQSNHNGKALDTEKVLAGLSEGERDEQLFKYACRLREKGMDRDEAAGIIMALAQICKPPFPEAEALKKVESAYGYLQDLPRVDGLRELANRLGEQIGISNQTNKITLSVTPEQSKEWPEPSPLPDGLPPVKHLDSAMIPAPWRGWLMDIPNRMQIPPDYSTAAAVVAAGSIIGRGCGIHPKRHDDWLVIPNLWGGVVGRPALLKTPAIAEAQKPLARLETEARKEYLIKARTYEIDKEVMKATKAAATDELRKAVKTGSSTDEAKAKLEALQMEEPVRRRYQTQDGTTEKIGELLNQNPRGLLVNRDELIGWFRALDRDGREGDRAFYLEAWNGTGGYIYDRIGRGTLDIPALCLSVFGAITPGPLSAYSYQAQRGGIGDDGLLQRFQVLVWPDAPGEWINIDRFPDTKEKNRAWEIFKKLAGDIPGAVTDEGADIPALRFSPSGQEVFNSWRHNLETRLRSDHGFPPAMESHLAKYRSLMPSLALIFHLVEVADGTESEGPVSERAAIMAVTWCEYLETHAWRVYGASTAPGMVAAREIIKHIKRGEVTDGCKTWALWRPQWSRLTTPEEVKAGLEVLQEYDWLIVEKTASGERGGRPSETIRLNPKIFLKP